MKINNLHDYLIKIQSIAKIGLLYSKDPYAVRNYQEIQTLTREMLETLHDVKIESNNYFKRDIYPTPNISVRTIVFNKHKEFLMVREKNGGHYSLPGGWIDLYDAPSDAALREVLEEAGAQCRIVRLVGLLNRTPYQEASAVPAFVVIFEAEFEAFVSKHDHEILDVKWFSRDSLPTLSHMISKEEMEKILDATFNEKVIFD